MLYYNVLSAAFLHGIHVLDHVQLLFDDVKEVVPPRYNSCSELRFNYHY